jgi:NhaP-type Na+/H+ or K+/H+ antiporter
LLRDIRHEELSHQPDHHRYGFFRHGLDASDHPTVPHLVFHIIYVLIGVLLYNLISALPWPNPIWEEVYAVHLTELIIIISLMGTGLKIDQCFSLTQWKIPFCLVTVTMVFSIALVAVVSWWMLGFDPASALLLGAVLAPTDPVLASDVQVGPPLERRHDNVRFALTAEAGLNDGMAFPFTWLAIAVATAATPTQTAWEIVSIMVHGVTAPYSIRQRRKQFEQQLE